MKPELFVAISTLISAAASVFIVYLKLRPGLRVHVLKCTHRIAGHRNQRGNPKEASTIVEVKFKILNTGAKTSIHKIGLNCKTLGYSFETSEKVKSRSFIKIGKGEILEYVHSFLIPNCEFFETPLRCKFSLHHTYGKKKLRTKSNLQLN